MAKSAVARGNSGANSHFIRINNLPKIFCHIDEQLNREEEDDSMAHLKGTVSREFVLTETVGV